MPTILIVDDAMFMRALCGRLLEENGYTVLQAQNGVEAVNKYREMRPDGVLLDITMPEMDGIQALKEIRAIDPAARVAMVTAVGQQAMVMSALKAGAMEFVMKPFDAEKVLAAVQKLLANKPQRQSQG
ncbi:MAG: response regulator [Chloroflexota bacterium]|nr:response regulator [Chloroflexota bacterium]